MPEPSLIDRPNGPPSELLPPETAEIREIIAGRYVGIRATTNAHGREKAFVLQGRRSYVRILAEAAAQMTAFALQLWAEVDP